MKNRSLKVLSQLALLLSLTMAPQTANASELKTFGILGGFSFPKVAFAKLDFNILENFGLDYQMSLGIFWSISQVDVLYYLSRGEWSFYTGLGYQSWNFYGFSSSTNYNGVVFGSGSQASAITIPVGLLYVAESGFAFNISVGADAFTNAPGDLQGRVIPEAGIAIGYYF